MSEPPKQPKTVAEIIDAVSADIKEQLLPCRSNSPAQFRQRIDDPNKSLVWEVMRRLDVNTDEGHTHQCLLCAKLFKVSRKGENGSWYNSKPKRHVQRNHKDCKVGV